MDGVSRITDPAVRELVERNYSAVQLLEQVFWAIAIIKEGLSHHNAVAGPQSTLADIVHISNVFLSRVWEKFYASTRTVLKFATSMPMEPDDFNLKQLLLHEVVNRLKEIRARDLIARVGDYSRTPMESELLPTAPTSDYLKFLHARVGYDRQSAWHYISCWWNADIQHGRAAYQNQTNMSAGHQTVLANMWRLRIVT